MSSIKKFNQFIGGNHPENNGEIIYKRLPISKKSGRMDEDHGETENYMFFANISNIKRMCEEILEMDPDEVDDLLSNGHGWATDHIATSKDDVEEVYGFLKSSMGYHNHEDMISDGEEC